MGKVAKFFKDLLKKSNFEQDLRKLMVQSAQNPGDLRLKLQIGKLYFKKKDLRNGIALYREVAEKYTEDKFTLKAIAVYKEILRYSPSSIEFNEKLGDLFLQLGMIADAVRQYRIAFHYYRNHRQIEAAVRSALKMVEADPKTAAYRVRLAELYVNQGLEEEAFKQYEIVVAQLKGSDQDLATLSEVYEKILAKRPQDMELLRALCECYLKLRKPQKVVRKLEKLKLSQTPDFKEIYIQAQKLKVEVGDLELQ